MPEPKKMLSLDGLRGVAILLVFLHHYGAGGTTSSSAFVRALAAVCGVGWCGVDLFFVLSGFLITGILFDSARDPSYYRNFYARRALRIFPIYYLFALVALFIVPLRAWPLGSSLFLVYLGYPAAVLWPSIIAVPLRITHLWSLSIEEQFYFAWPWLVRRLERKRSIIAFCLAAIVIAPLLRLASPRFAYALLFCRMDGLALGASLAILFRSAKWKVCQRLALLVLVVNVAVIVSICVTRNTTAHDDTWIRTAGFSAIVFASGALLVLALGPLQRVLSVHILRLFGKYSYGLYLYHLPLTGVLVRLKPWFAQGAFGSVLYVAAALLINLCVAALSFHLFEQPILKFKDRFSYRSTQKSLPETLRPEVNIGQAADWATLEATQPITNLTALHPRVASASKPDARSA